MYGYASQLHVYASQIRVPNWHPYTRPNFASQIDVPIRVPNELFIKVQSVQYVCIRVPNWGVYTRPKLTCIYASRIEGYIRVPDCVYIRVPTSVYICVYSVFLCILCIFRDFYVFIFFCIFPFSGLFCGFYMNFLFFSFDCMRISLEACFECMKIFSDFIEFFVYFRFPMVVRIFFQLRFLVKIRFFWSFFGFFLGFFCIEFDFFSLFFIENFHWNFDSILKLYELVCNCVQMCAKCENVGFRGARIRRFSGFSKTRVFRVFRTLWNVGFYGFFMNFYDFFMNFYDFFMIFYFFFLMNEFFFKIFFWKFFFENFFDGWWMENFVDSSGIHCKELIESSLYIYVSIYIRENVYFSCLWPTQYDFFVWFYVFLCNFL